MFPEVKQTGETVNIWHALRDILSVSSSLQRKILHPDTHNHMALFGKAFLLLGENTKKRSLTNHRGVFYHVKSIFVISLALPLLEPHLDVRLAAR